MNETVIGTLVFGAFLFGVYKYAKRNKTSTPPVNFPEPTRPIRVNGVLIGPAAYSKEEDGETSYVTTIRVETEGEFGIVYFTFDNDDMLILESAPVRSFLNEYTEVSRTVNPITPPEVRTPDETIPK